jgi:hypothetical protein
MSTPESKPRRRRADTARLEMYITRIRTLLELSGPLSVRDAWVVFTDCRCVLNDDDALPAETQYAMWVLQSLVPRKVKRS